jgi:hypothetical protein
MHERALMGAMFGIGVVTAFVAGLELGLVEVRPPDAKRVPAMSAANEAARPAPAWSPPTVAPAEAAPRVEPVAEAPPRVEPPVEAERRDAAAAAPARQTDPPTTRVSEEAARVAGVRPPPAVREQVPEMSAAPSRESRPGQAPSLALSTRPPAVADVSPPRAAADRPPTQPGSVVPPARTRPDVRLPPLVVVPVAPGPREPLVPDATTARTPAAPSQFGEPLMGSAMAAAKTAPDPLIAARNLRAPQTAVDSPAATEFARSEPMRTSEPDAAPGTDATVRARETFVPTASSAPEPHRAPPTASSAVTHAREAPAGTQPTAPLRELSQTRTAGVVGPPLARSAGEPPAAAAAPVDVPIARSDAPLARAPEPVAGAPPIAPAPSQRPAASPVAAPSSASPVAAPSSAASPSVAPSPPATSSVQSSRVATAPATAVEPPEPARRNRNAASANLTAPPPPDEPSTHAPDRPRKSATPSRKRSRTDMFRSRASLGQPTRVTPRRSRVSLHYGAPPAYRGSGPILIRIHRGRNGRVRTTRMPVYW